MALDVTLKVIFQIGTPMFDPGFSKSGKFYGRISFDPWVKVTSRGHLKVKRLVRIANNQPVKAIPGDVHLGFVRTTWKLRVFNNLKDHDLYRVHINRSSSTILSN